MYFKHPFKSQASRLWKKSCSRLNKLLTILINFSLALKSKSLLLIKKKQTRSSFSKHPLYLLMGKSESGKSSLVAHSGLLFHTEEEPYQPPKINDLHFWASETITFIEPNVDTNSTISDIHKKLIRFLRKERRSKPLNGVILTVELCELLTLTAANRQSFINGITQSIHLLSTQLKCKLPVYLLFTKCDKVCGFSEYFQDQSQESRQQVWGATLPLSNSNELNSLLAWHHQEFEQLMTRLRQQLVYSLDSQKDPNKRKRLFLFPEQMSLFNKPIATLITELFGPTGSNEKMQFRGFYFTSSTQTGPQNDFLQLLIGQPLQLKNHAEVTQHKTHYAYFINRLITDVMIPDSAILGFNRHSKKLKTCVYKSLRIVLPCLLLTVVLTVIFEINHLKKNVHVLENNIGKYHSQLELESHSSHWLINLMPALKQLQNTYNRFTPSILLIPSQHLHHQLREAIQRNLQNRFLPGIAASLEKALSSNKLNIDQSYALLKAYLAFNLDQHTPKHSIIASMEYLWSQNHNLSPPELNQARKFLQLAAQQPFTSLPLDHDLIKRIRSQLLQIAPEERGFGLLLFKANEKNLENLSLHRALGIDANLVFERNINKISIPAIYTHKGFQEIFQQEASSIAQEVQHDNAEIGLHQEIDKVPNTTLYGIQKIYTKKYLETWKIALRSLKIRKSHSLTQLIAMLNFITNNQSVLNRLLNLVRKHTYTISTNNHELQSYFIQLNQFKTDQLSKDIAELKNDLLDIRQANNVNQAAFNATSSILKPGNNNSFNKILRMALHSPEPIKHWLMQILEQSWQLLCSKTLSYLNAKWSENIITYYHENFTEHYPFEPHATKQTSIQKFETFFKPNGLLSQFQQHYLNNFIILNNHKLQLRYLQQFSISLSHKSLRFLNHANKIKRIFFAEGAQHASIKFSIKPHNLSRNSSQALLRIDNHTLLYQHGPELAADIQWPSTQLYPQAQITLSDFKYNKETRVFNGPWSLFKLLASFNLTSIDPTIWRIHMQHMNMSYRLKGPTNFNFHLFALRNLDMPNTLGASHDN